MTVFWLLVSTLIVAGLAALLLPMLRHRASTDVDERELRLAVYRDRRREIDGERAAGRLTAAEAEAAIDELAGDALAQFDDASASATGGGSQADGAERHRTAGAAAGMAAGLGGAATAGGGRARVRSSHRWLAGALTVAVPVLTVVGYLHLGSPGLIDLDPSVARGQPTAADIEQALDALQRRVREQPDDAQAWTLLARARRVQGDLPGATQAFAEATRLLPQDARLLAEFAETIAASRDGDFSGQPEQLLEQALRLSPTEPKALALMGAAQYRLGHRDRALTYLRTLLAGMDPQSEQARQIETVAQRIADEIGAAGGAAPPSAASRPPASAATPRASTRPSTAGVSGRITIASGLRAQVPADATLFVSARLPDGPRIPLAALRLPVGAWPVEFDLTDAQAMTPEHRISQAEQVIVEARISRSGTAIRQPGDLIGSSAPIAPGSPRIDLQIDRVVP